MLGNDFPDCKVGIVGLSFDPDDEVFVGGDGAFNIIGAAIQTRPTRRRRKKQ